MIAIIFRTSIIDTVDVWMNSPEYNYGPLIPVLVTLMLWRDLARSTAGYTGGWWGLAIVLVGLLLGLLEFLSRTHFPGQVGLFLTLIGIFIAWQGEARAREVWPALVFLLFGLPMANAIQVILTSALQMVSSVGAVAIIRAMNIPVLREGNVIDLGTIKLQVAEACSGLRYLFPLAAFSFLCAYLFMGHPAKRAVIFLSSVPITIAMNIVRIAVTGVLVDRFGVEAAQGFFHEFEGWVVYCCCLFLLFVEMKMLCFIGSGDRSLLRRLDLDLPKGRSTMPDAHLVASGHKLWPSRWAVGLCVLTIVTIASIGTRVDAAPSRTQFSLFPRQIGVWTGFEFLVDPESLAALNATDHLSLNFAQGDNTVVNLWVAYYQSQYSGSAAHSPLVCIPGGGWQIESLDTISLPVDTGNSMLSVPINRLVIAQGSRRQLVYYWFVEGGVVETNEYLAKARLFANAVIDNRRDGALVRFITPIENGDFAAADLILGNFVREATPLLPRFLP
ncbi:MAG: VPLPA-CTERM-specific exosortase XrtD [Rhodospirillaceae bacterium]|nr:VPLPA-CTERM-specific exosortase XrtD [Rhodospirillaceae bacterium]